MNVTPGPLSGLLIFEPTVFGDARGFFMETWNARRYREAGLDAAAFAAALDRRQYAARVGELLRQAYEELRITGVPYFVIGSQALTGLQTREDLEEAIDLAAREG
jgi:protein-disulfide isomerase